MSALRTDEHAPPTQDTASRRPRPLTAAVAVLALLATLLVGIQIGRAIDGPGTAGAGDPEDADRVAAAEEDEGEDVVVPDELTWAPPELDDPKTVTVSNSNRNLKLDHDTDYVIEMPDEPLTSVRGLNIYGGRNVVLIGGEIHLPEEALTADHHGGRGLYLNAQRGTVHVEGLHITGPGLKEGINLNQRAGATVQLQNIRVETVQGSREGAHADVLQTWAGPSVLRVDRLTGSTTYQGLFLLPKQFIDDEPELFDLRNLNINGEEGAYLLWRDSDDWPLETRNVWVATGRDVDKREAYLWAEGDETGDTWDDVQVGTPPDGDFVPADAVGLDYRSPGYLDDSSGD